MELDWVTVSAQVVNFLILIWLLKRFLYAPVVNAMDRRERRIADRLEEAEQREHEAAAEARRHREALETLESERDEIMDEANRKAEQERRRLLDEARAEVEETRAEWQRQAENEKQEFLRGLRRETGATVEAIARRALRGLADVELESQLVHVLVSQLELLDAGVRAQLADTSGPVRIASAFELEPPTRSRLTRAVHEQLGPDVAVEYVQDPELLCGIRLTRAGRRLGWSLADYMEELGARFETAWSPAGAASGGD